MSDSLIAKLLGRKQAKDKTLQQRKDQFIREFATGKLNVDAAEKGLDELGMTPEQLAAAADRWNKRVKAHAAVVAGQTVPAEQARAEQALAEADAAYQAACTVAEQKFIATRDPLNEKLQQLKAIEKAAGEGRQLLESTFANPEVEGQIAELQARQRPLNDKAAKASRAAGSADSEAQSLRGESGCVGANAPNEEGRKALRQKAAQREMEAASHRATAEKADEEYRALQVQIDALAALKMKP
jgi:hypothetical protein